MDKTVASISQRAHIDICFVEHKVENVSVVGDTFLSRRFRDDDESLGWIGRVPSQPNASLEKSHEGASRRPHSVQAVADENLRRALAVFVRELDHDRMVEPLPANERSPRLEHDALGLAVLDELCSSHERVQVDLVDGGDIFRRRREEILEVLLSKVPVRERGLLGQSLQATCRGVGDLSLTIHRYFSPCPCP